MRVEAASTSPRPFLRTPRRPPLLPQRAVRPTATAEGNGRLEELVEAIARREMDPHTAAERLIQAAD